MRPRSINFGAIVAVIGMIAFFAWVVTQMAEHRHGSLGTNLVIKLAMGFGAVAVAVALGALLTVSWRRKKPRR